MATPINQSCNLAFRPRKILESVLKAPHLTMTSFMHLPWEIRQMIYIEHFLAHPVIITPDSQRTQSGSVDRKPRFHASIELLLVSKAIYQESQPLLFSYTTFSFESFISIVSWEVVAGDKDPNSCLRLSADVGSKIQRVRLKDIWANNFEGYFRQPVALPLSILRRIFNIRPKSLIIDINCWNFRAQLSPGLKSYIYGLGEVLHDPRVYNNLELFVDLKFIMSRPGAERKPKTRLIHITIDHTRTATIIERDASYKQELMEEILSTHLKFDMGEVRNA